MLKHGECLEDVVKVVVIIIIIIRSDCHRGWCFNHWNYPDKIRIPQMSCHQKEPVISGELEGLLGTSPRMLILQIDNPRLTEQQDLVPNYPAIPPGLDLFGPQRAAAGPQFG